MLKPEFRKTSKKLQKGNSKNPEYKSKINYHNYRIIHITICIYGNKSWRFASEKLCYLELLDISIHESHCHKHIYAKPNMSVSLLFSEVSEKLAITKTCTKNVSCELQINATIYEMPCDQSLSSWVCTNCCHDDACNYDAASHLNGFHWIPIIFATFSVLIISMKL